MEEQLKISLETIASLNDAMAALTATNKTQAERIESQQVRIKELTAQVAWLNRQLFGRKSEKLNIIDPNQPTLFPELFAEETKQAEAARDEAIEKIEEETPKDRKQKRQNRKMLEDLPVLEKVVIRPENLDTDLYKKIGEEVTQIVEHKPGQLYVRQIIREKWALKDNTQLPPEGMKPVLVGDMPELPIYKGVAGPSLLAEILLQKYEYHMPFYRQIQQFAHLGMKGLTDSTMNDWFKQAVNLLRPLYEALKAEVFKSDYTQADETTTPVIDKEKHKATKEYLWMVRSVMERLVIFHYDKGSRAGAVIENLAREHNFKGYMQCDGFAGYETAFNANPDVTLVNCMVHIRRHFEQALDENRDAAGHALKQIRLLYQVEHMCDDADLSFDERKAKRTELAKPIMDAMKVWMENEGVKYSERSLMGKAITYAYNRWENMMHYLDDGRILLDNNLAENAIRPITLGRKNYLFCGNHQAAENMAVICSLLATCKAQDINPREYLNDVIARMPYLKKPTHEDLVRLLPHRWKENRQS